MRTAKFLALPAAAVMGTVGFLTMSPADAAAPATVPAAVVTQVPTGPLGSATLQAAFEAAAQKVLVDAVATQQAAAAAQAAQAQAEAEAAQAAAEAAANTAPSVQATPASSTSAVSDSGSSNGGGVVDAALSRVGSSYVHGGEGPRSFDCSGLTMWAYKQVGISLPHYSGAQMSAGRPVSLSEMRPGDLMFWGSGGSRHAAMYIGDGQIVAAGSPSSGVYVGSYSYDMSRGDFAGARRYL